MLDPSVVIDLQRYVRRPDALPEEAVVSAITLAEIVQAPLFARDEDQRRVRERLVLDALRAFPEPVPFDMACVSAYRSVATATVAAGRQPRRRTIDLLIAAATAHAHGLALYTRNAADVDHLSSLTEIVVPQVAAATPN